VCHAGLCPEGRFGCRHLTEITVTAERAFRQPHDLHACTLHAELSCNLTCILQCMDQLACACVFGSRQPQFLVGG
jgi:hypothetical protein